MSGEGALKKSAGEKVTSVFNTRLFVNNLSYTVLKDELQSLFGLHGAIESVEIPLRKGGHGIALGYAYISFKE